MPAYFTLVSSLPALTDFERMKRLPLNRERLEARLEMLTPEDRAEARRAEAFLTWHHQPLHFPDERVLSAYQEVMQATSNAMLADLVATSLRRRTLQAALRRRHRGGAAPEPKEAWGEPRMLYTVRRNWSRPDFGLGAVHRWVGPMVEHLRDGNAVALERVLLRHSWDTLDALVRRERPRFSFEAVLLYLFQWDIASRWLAYDAARANERFDALIDEAWHGLDVN